MNHRRALAVLRKSMTGRHPGIVANLPRTIGATAAKAGLKGGHATGFWAPMRAPKSKLKVSKVLVFLLSGWNGDVDPGVSFFLLY